MSFTPLQYIDVDEAFTTESIKFQIIDIIDISHSKLTQLDQWKEHGNPNMAFVDRLNKTNTHVVREINMNEDENENEKTNSSSTNFNTVYKLTLQDQHGNCSFAYEYNDKLSFLRDPNLENGTPLPMKLGGIILVKKGTLIMNGVLMLNNAQCSLLSVDESCDTVKKLNSGIVKKHIEHLSQELHKH